MADSVKSSKPIVLEPQPRGRFSEGYLITGYTPKPGTVMSKESTNGYWRPGFPSGSNGDHWPIAVLVEDKLQGRTSDDAYVDIGSSGSALTGTTESSRCFLYYPVHGERLNMLLGDVGGTGDTQAIWQKYIVIAASGKLLKTTGSPAMEAFAADEAIAAPSADTLIRCVFIGA